MVRLLKGWAGIFDTVFLLVFGYSFLEFLAIASSYSIGELLNFKNAGNLTVMVLGLIFGTVRLIDYFAKRKTLKSIERLNKQAAINNKVISLEKKKIIKLERELLEIRLRQQSKKDEQIRNDK